MDSATSGSLQSSSGGGGGGDYDDFTSRPNSLSSFLNLPPSSSSSSSFLLDSLSTYLHPFPQSPPSIPNPFSSPWPPRSPPNPPPSSSSAAPNPPPTAAAAAAAASCPARGSKKRSRASRRAPTTVLTTDTSNFRAMVQEFTGFPSPPFSASHFPRPRLDLSHPPSIPPYLLRPFAQKFNPPPFLPPLSSPPRPPPSILDSINNTNSSTSSASASTSLPYCPTSNLLNIQNPILQFQSMPTFGVRPPQGSLDFGDLGSLIASDRINLGSRVDGNCKLNQPPPDFQPEKRKDSSPATRGDGVVDSWIVSSD